MTIISPYYCPDLTIVTCSADYCPEVTIVSADYCPEVTIVSAYYYGVPYVAKLLHSPIFKDLLFYL